MKWPVACCLVLLSAPVLDAAARGQANNLSDADLLAYLGNMQLEARLDADITGDGRLDTVYVASDRNARVLGVIAGGKRSAQIGRRAIAEGALDASPHAAAVLQFANGVLTVEDLGGSVAATLTRYQYRYAPKQNRMRLFNLVCEQYSPTLSHGSRRISWNVGRGDQLVEHGQVVTLDSGQQVYVYSPQRRASRKTTPVYMEDVPSSAQLFAAESRPRSRVASREAPAP